MELLTVYPGVENLLMVKEKEMELPGLALFRPYNITRKAHVYYSFIRFLSDPTKFNLTYNKE
jgi:hypothetical protein